MKSDVIQVKREKKYDYKLIKQAKVSQTEVSSDVPVARPVELLNSTRMTKTFEQLLLIFSIKPTVKHVMFYTYLCATSRKLTVAQFIAIFICSA